MHLLPLLGVLAACVPLSPSGGPLDTANLGPRKYSDGVCGDDWDGDGTSFAAGDCRPGQGQFGDAGSEVCNGVDDDCDGAVDNGADGCYLGKKGGVAGIGYGHTWWKAGISNCDGELGGGWISYGFDSELGGTGCVVSGDLYAHGDEPKKACPECEFSYRMAVRNIAVNGDLCAVNDWSASILSEFGGAWGFDGRNMLLYQDDGWFVFATTSSQTATVAGDKNYVSISISPASSGTFYYEGS